ncbi:HlyD family type I secretion periplasmic adaptor subunit [Palleronia rufa]|uniref:HlyD family type I secretion periplasmic adaptor subunit n=1 Tax=Palleronia rufa TaxID=1530186 RepID=UPI00069171F2|nr:HlyD family type I secretion periplasmic adaptor subunit [Palleronia rufa]
MTHADDTPTDTAFRHPFGPGLAIAGFAIILFFGGTFAAWSVIVPMASAVVAPGLVSVDTNVRTVQHLEGGIIQSIEVREGTEVEAGDILLRLDNTIPAAVMTEVQARIFELQALEARLLAERDGADKVTFPKELRLKVGDAAAQEAMQGQKEVFASRRALLSDRLTVLEQTRAGIESEIEGLEGQIASAERQLSLLGDEMETVTTLLDRQLAQRSRLQELQREQAKLEGTISSNRAAIGTARQRMEETTLRMSELRASEANSVVEELRATRANAYELRQKLAEARDVLRRTEIIAPIPGVVVNLGVSTVGGVVAPGQALLDLVPSGDKLVIQATIDPLDIDQVSVGLPATVWLSALNRRSQTGIEGSVKTISADRITDPRTGAAYYLSRIELDPEDVEGSEVPLQPGMSAEIMIRTGERTAWDYIAAPISRAISRGLREE